MDTSRKAEGVSVIAERFRYCRLCALPRADTHTNTHGRRLAQAKERESEKCAVAGSHT
jgi:hypothetical protein